MVKKTNDVIAQDISHWTKLVAITEDHKLPDEVQNEMLKTLNIDGVSPSNTFTWVIFHFNAAIKVDTVKLLLLLGFHENLDYNQRSHLLSNAMKSKNKEILKALQETGILKITDLRNHIWFSAHNYKNIDAETLKLVVEIFHWDVLSQEIYNPNLLRNCSFTDKIEIGQLYKKHLERFAPTKTTTLGLERGAKQAEINYNWYLSPLAYYCQNNLWDEKARKIYHDLNGETDQSIQLNIDYLKNRLATLLKSASGEAKAINSEATLALILCYCIVVPNKTAESLGIHASYIKKIEPEILKLKEKEVSANFKLKCLNGVTAAAGLSVGVAIACLVLLHPAATTAIVLLFYVSTVLMVGTIARMIISGTINAQKNFIQKQLTMTNSLFSEPSPAAADKAAPDKAAPDSESPESKPRS